MNVTKTKSRLAAAILLAGAVVAGPAIYRVVAADSAPAGAAAPAAAPTTQPGKRSAEDVMKDLNAASQDVQKALGDSAKVLFDAKKRAEVAPKAIPAFRKLANLFDELAEVHPQVKTQAKEAKMQLEAILSLLGDQEATASLTKSAASADPAEATAGKGLQLMVRWWQAAGDAAQQNKVVDDFQALAKQNPENDALAQMIAGMMDQATGNEMKARMENIVVSDLKGPFAKQLGKQIQDRQKLRAMEGKPLTIEGAKLDGKKFSSADWKGKVVLVDFWATWCGPCMQELPHVKKVYADYHDKGLEIVGVSCDRQASDLTDFLTKNPDMPWPQLFDASKPGWHQLAKDYGVNGIPTMFLIDRKGTLRSVEARDKLDELIPQLLAEKAQ